MAYAKQKHALNSAIHHTAVRIPPPLFLVQLHEDEEISLLLLFR